jgi:hypothetical protein
MRPTRALSYNNFCIKLKSFSFGVSFSGNLEYEGVKIIMFRLHAMPGHILPCDNDFFLLPENSNLSSLKVYYMLCKATAPLKM